MGKTTKEFTLTKPNSPASKGRTYALYCAVGVDVRDVEGLNNQMAHKFLNDSNNGKAYDVRAELLTMGGRAAKKDVAKEHRDDPKPKKAKAKTEPEHTDDDLAILLKLLKKRPELIKAALADVAEEIEDEDEEVVKPAPKPKAKPTTKAQKREASAKAATGTKVTTKSGKTVTINKDDTISDADLLSMLGKAINV